MKTTPCGRVGRKAWRRLGLALGLVLAAGLLPDLAASAFASDQPLWIRRLVTAERDYALGVTTDARGNVIAVGATGGALVGRHRGNLDAWVAKYDPRGRLLWARQFGTTADDIAQAVATDAEANIVVAGATASALGGTNHGAGGIFLIKYSPAGRPLWKKLLGNSENDGLRGMAVDGGGNVIVAGIADFFSGPSWLAKFDPDGHRLWRHRLGEAVSAVATAAAGNIVVAGVGEGFVAWVAKHDSEGRRLWRRQLSEVANAVATDTKGNIITSGGQWLVKYNGEGGMLWRLGASEGVVATDADENIILSYSLSSSGACNDGYITKYNAHGHLLWQQVISKTYINSVATDATGDVVIAGNRAPLLGAECGKRIDALIAKYSGD